jgi:hypothetical protein
MINSIPGGQAISTIYWYEQLRRYAVRRSVAAFALLVASMVGIVTLVLLAACGLALGGHDAVAPVPGSGGERLAVGIDAPGEILNGGGVAEIRPGGPLEYVGSGVLLVHPGERRRVNRHHGALGGAIAPLVGKRRAVRRGGRYRGRKCGNGEEGQNAGLHGLF